MINRLQKFCENSTATAHGVYRATHQAAVFMNQKVTQYATDSLTSLQQQTLNAKENLIETTTLINNHPLTPYVVTGLLSMAIGSVFSLPIATSLVLGISTKLATEGMDAIIERTTTAITRILHYLGCNRDLRIPVTWKQTATVLPIGLGCFALGLNVCLVSAMAKIASFTGVAIIGSFALGYATHA